MSISRRRLIASSLPLLGLPILPRIARVAHAAGAQRTFRLWVIADAHIGTDLKKGRRSLAEAIGHSERGGAKGAPPFEFDIALHLGDMSGNQAGPTDDEGLEAVSQYATSTRHPREHFYDLAGNHDASAEGEPTQWWFRKYLDPTGENTAHSGVDPKKRPYPVEGTWERYTFRVGNLMFMMMCDRNDGPHPVGRGTRGGYPSGAVTGETFEWWKQNVGANRDSIIISAHHHMLRETTIASGDWEGHVKKPDGTWTSGYHGYYPDGGPEGSSYLYFVDGKPKAMAFEKHLEASPGAIDMWLGGHTHASPGDVVNGRSHVERKWGATFINCCALTRWHAASHSVPLSRLITFTEGSKQARVQCYLHTNKVAPEGWYDKVERTIELGKPFRMT